MIIQSIFLKMISFIIFYIFCIDETSLLTEGKYYYSMIILGFLVLFTIITSIKYTTLRLSIQSKSKFKYLYAIATILISFVILNSIFIYGQKYCEIHDWYETRTLKDFLFIPIEYRDILDINILKMTIVESIFSMLLVIITFVRDKTTNGIIGYISERILKFCFRYNVIFTFFIYTFTISSKFLDVGTTKNIGRALLSLTGVILAIKYYLAIIECLEKNKQKYGKENLVIVITTTNCKFTLEDEYRNPLHFFRKYNRKNWVKSLMVRGQDYTFISYDAIRYKLIEPDQYKNIAYLIILRDNMFEGIINKEEETFLEKMIGQLEKEDKNYIIYCPENVEPNKILVNRLKQKYKFRYKTKLNVKDVLNITKLNENDDELKQKCQNILQYIEQREIENYVQREFGKKLNQKELILKKDELIKKLTQPADNFIEEKEQEKLRKLIEDDKNIYVKYALNDMLNTYNYIEYFYDLLKTGEYIIHYMGLDAFLDNPKEAMKRVGINDIRTGFLSTWRKCINFDVEYSIQNTKKLHDIASEADVVNSINKIRTLIPKKIKEFKATSFKYGVCQILSDIRNNIVAHGVVTDDLAKEIIDDLLNIIFISIKQFENIDITIEKDKQIKDILKQEFTVAYKEKGRLYLYSMSNYDREEKVDLYQEYLNYETGTRRITNNNVKLKMNLRYTDSNIEEEIGERAIK